MKKFLFTTALAAGFLCSCSSDDAPVAASQQPSAAQEDLVPVELSVGSPVSVSKKGTGVVGGIDNDEVGDGDNVWAGEDLYLLMMERSNSDGNNAWGYSQWSYLPTPGSEGYNEGNNTEVTFTNFEDLLVKAPTGAASGAINWSASQDPAQPKYYPTKGIHDFFAYRIDDAYVDGDPAEGVQKPALEDAENSKYINFVIDGSQDLMVGRADNDEKVVETNFPKGFSQATARAGKTPIISMKHLLTRFTFEVSGAGNNTLEGLSVTKIAVKSRTTGKMKVAYDLGALDAVPTDLIEFTGDEVADKIELELKQRTGGANAPLVALAPIPLETETEEVEGVVGPKKDGDGNIMWKSYKAGESLMVEAGQETYEIIVTVKQKFKPDHEPAYEGEVEKPYTITIASATGQTGGVTTAQAGTSYNVKIKVYGLEEIKVEAALTPWVDGGNVDAVEQ